MALTAQALTTLDALKAELGIHSGHEDAYLEALIERSSARLASLCERSFHHQAGVVERATGYATPFLLLRVRPVLSVASVVVRGETLGADSYRIKPAEGLLVRTCGAWGRYAQGWGVEREPIAGSELDEAIVTYTGGYVTPAQATAELPRTLPFDIEEAALALAVLAYRQRGRDATIKSEKILSASITYATGGEAATLPAVVRDVVTAYREVAL